jgi:cytochrome c-type biogenesis protein CcmH/NrfG
MNRKNEVSALLSKARAAEQKGDYAASFFNLGSALALSGQFDEAAEAYRKAVRIAPHVAAARIGQSWRLTRIAIGRTLVAAARAIILTATARRKNNFTDFVVGAWTEGTQAARKCKRQR